MKQNKKNELIERIAEQKPQGFKPPICCMYDCDSTPKPTPPPAPKCKTCMCSCTISLCNG